MIHTILFRVKLLYNYLFWAKCLKIVCKAKLCKSDLGSDLKIPSWKEMLLMVLEANYWYWHWTFFAIWLSISLKYSFLGVVSIQMPSSLDNVLLCCLDYTTMLSSSGRSGTLGTPRRQRSGRSASEYIERRDLDRCRHPPIPPSPRPPPIPPAPRQDDLDRSQSVLLSAAPTPDSLLCIDISTRTPSYAFLPRPSPSSSRHKSPKQSNPISSIRLKFQKRGANWDNLI